MTEAIITPELIKWARERYNLTTDIVAEKINVAVDKINAWERGESYPTFRQAQNLAQKLNIPFGYLFLSAPPLEKLPLPDLRTVSGIPTHAPSPELSDLLDDVLRKQQWYREYQESEGAQSISFIGRFTTDDSPQIIAKDIKETLNIDDDMRQDSQNWEQFLREFIRRSESVGILVMRSGIVKSNTHRKLDVQEFRGFAISDDLAPLVFINAQDAKAAQIFTLAHELVHLWIGESGISKLEYIQRPSEQQNYIDRFCDQIAAEILIPSDEFLLHWQDMNTTDQNIRLLAIKYRVSTLVVLRRAYEHNKLSFEDYRAHYQELVVRRRGGATQGGGDFYKNLLARNSNTLTLTLLIAALEGHVPHRDASQLLNVKVKRLNNIYSMLESRFANA